MHIAILGTRGIPNNYGGPETNAECLGPQFIDKGHRVTVYSPNDHPYAESSWNGIEIRHVFCNERRLGIWGTLLYDYLCLRDALVRDYDVILELGHVPCALFFPFRRRRRTKIVTNMDGLEWKRSKWNFALQRFAKLTEVLGARFSDGLIADNRAIKDYLSATYGKDSHFVPYGAELVDQPHSAHLERYAVEPRRYQMLIARMEPENNIETILEGYLASGTPEPFLVVGGTGTKHGTYLRGKFGGCASIRFLEGIYDREVLDALRWHAHLYWHGHSVGGTNPSLVEAMASNARIVAHDNPFNRSVVDSDAEYFSSTKDVADVINRDYGVRWAARIENNRRKVRETYDWSKLAAAHIAVFESVMKQE